MLDKLKEIICQYVDVDKDKITENSNFVEDLGFNSYDFMCLIGEIEEEFDIEVQERDVINIKTVKEAMDYISSLQD